MREWDLQFEGPVVEWRGPAPFYFVAIPAEESADIKFAAKCAWARRDRQDHARYCHGHVSRGEA